MVSELAALSKRKEYLALVLYSISKRQIRSVRHIHPAEILRYANVGVRMSAGIVAHTGTRFGGFGELLDAASTSCTVSSDGCILNYTVISRLPELRCLRVNVLVEPF